MKAMKKIISLGLATVMIASLFAGCGEKVEVNDDGTTVQGKKAIVAYNSVGYGHEWLEILAEEFNKMYAEEGYKVELKISMASENNPALEIGKGAEKNDVDLYLDAYNLESVLDASNKTMRGNGAVLVDLTESVWNKPAIGQNKQEERKTISERFLLDDTNLYYDGVQEEFHGGLYAIPTGMEQWSTGIVVNPTVLAQYGYTTQNLPKTTDEFNAMCAKIAETSSETGVYAYAWPGSNAAGYLTYLFFEYFAQYSGAEALLNFSMTRPHSDATREEILSDGWKVYEDKGILEGFKAMEPIMKPEYSPKGSASMTHMDAQHQLLSGKAACMVMGDWLLYQMKEEYYEEASQCLMMNTPVLSVIGTECGITDAQLSEAVKMVDEDKTDDEIMAAISELDAAEVARIREARNIYCGGEINMRSGMAIPAYADGRDVAILFARFLCSDYAQGVIRNKGYKFNCYECSDYSLEKDTPFMQSVLANQDPGDGIYVGMDSSLSIVRANSGMLYFNHPNLVQPVTFKNMILDTTGNLTAEKMYEMEKEYAKQNWSTWAAYVG